jgi:hypothetical protein
MAQRALPLEQAVDEANALCDRILPRFLQVHDRIRPTTGADLALYLQGLRHGVRGSNEWGMRVPRYLSLGRWPDEREDLSLTYAQEPSDSRPGPVEGAPGIAWWWDADLV